MPINSGIKPPDYSTTVGQVRLLTGDTDATEFDTPVAGYGSYAFFGDDELAGFLTLFSDKPKRAAIYVLSQVAISRALLLGKWSSDDLSVDEAAITEAIRKVIADLRKAADDEDATLDADYFDVVDTGDDTSLILRPEAAPWPIPTPNNIWGW